MIENVRKRTWNHAGIIFIAFHRKCFSCTGLTISKDCTIESLKNGIDQRMKDVGIDFILCRVDIIDRIKRIYLDIIVTGGGVWYIRRSIQCCCWTFFHLNRSHFTININHLGMIIDFLFVGDWPASNHHLDTFLFRPTRLSRLSTTLNMDAKCKSIKC